MLPAVHILMYCFPCSILSWIHCPQRKNGDKIRWPRGSQMPVRALPQQCMTNNSFFIISFCKHLGCHWNLRQMLINHFIFFHSKYSSSRVFSLLHPATFIDVKITRRHWALLFFCLMQNHEHAQNPALMTNTPRSQTDPELTSSLIPTTLLHLWMCFGKLFLPCMSQLPLKLLIAASVCSGSFSRQKLLMPEWCFPLNTKNYQEVFASYDTWFSVFWSFSLLGFKY